MLLLCTWEGKRWVFGQSPFLASLNQPGLPYPPFCYTALTLLWVMMISILEMLGMMMAVLLVQYCDDHCLQWLRVFGHLLKRELFELHLNVLWSLAMLQMMTMMMMISPAPSWVLPSVRKCRCAKKVSGREMVIRFLHNYSLSDCASNWSLSHCSENIVFTLPSKSRTEYH